jgi:hypothetical protein
MGVYYVYSESESIRNDSRHCYALMFIRYCNMFSDKSQYGKLKDQQESYTYYLHDLV